MRTATGIVILVFCVPVTNHEGTVVNLGRETLTIETDDGQQRTFVVTAGTEITRDKQQVDLQQIQPGDSATVTARDDTLADRNDMPMVAVSIRAESPKDERE